MYCMRFTALNKTSLDVSISIEKMFDNPQDANEALYKAVDLIDPDIDMITFKKVFRIITCSCGNKIECTNFTNTCDCGKDYNFSGSLLAPRECWGEETGEHWTDIINCDYDNEE